MLINRGFVILTCGIAKGGAEVLKALMPRGIVLRAEAAFKEERQRHKANSLSEIKYHYPSWRRILSRSSLRRS
jgi:hypothetical protein